jgi:cell division protease FtsH
MITQYGMSDVLGAAVLEVRTGTAYLELGAPARHECSEETARRIDAEIQRLLSEAEGRVEATLTQRRQELDTLAATLLRQETVEREFLARLLTVRAEERKADAA